MSSPSDDDDDDKDEGYQKERPDLPAPSAVSMRSDKSMGAPIVFQEGKKERYQKERTDSAAPSAVSLRSDKSMGAPIVFQEERKERYKPGLSNLSLLPDADFQSQHLRPESTASNVRVMEHNNGTRGLDPVWNQRFKSILKNKFGIINEGIPMHGKSRLLNEIYTELYITSDCGSRHLDELHEVRRVEREFMRRYETTEECITCNEIFKPTSGKEKPTRTVLTEGIAGIGKTVSVQKFVLDWAEGKANRDFDFIFPFNFRELNFRKEEDLSLIELLHCLIPEIKELKTDYHHHRILVIFDGLDESRFSINFQNSKILTDPTASASLDILLTNLIKGNLLPSAFLWITSRPAASSQIPPVYINRVTEIRGFNDPQKDEYFRKRISDQTLANKIISHLKSSRSLYIMCHMPVFCWITATVLEGMFSEAGTGDVPKTLTQMFTHFLILQLKRGSQKYKRQEMNSQQIADIVLKLGKLAYQQLEKGNLIFYEEDITEYGIDVREATVYSGVCTQIFIEEVTSHLGKVYSFVHLSVQEHLAAVYAFLSCVNGNLSKQKTVKIFKATLLDLLKVVLDQALQSKNGHLDLFLRFLMGLSLESNSVLLQDLLTERGHRYLREKAANTKKGITKHIRKMIADDPTICHSVNLFHCLIELNDLSLVQEVQVFLDKPGNNRLKGVDFSSVQWLAVVFLLMNSEEDLKEFNLQKYAASEDCLMHLYPVAMVSRKALLRGCNLTEKSGDVLVKALNSEYSFMRELDLSDNELQDSGVKGLSTGLMNPHCKLEILRLCGCKLTEKSGEVLANTLNSDCSCLRELDLSDNKLQNSGVKMLSLGLMSPHCKLEILSLRNCSITEEGCVTLAEALRKKSHLRELDLRGNHLGEQGVKLLSEIKEDKKYTLETLR
ncbi:NLR family CARD domain-containing protein 3-like [Clarias gariepinus]